MFPPFSQNLAIQQCISLMQKLDDFRRLDFETEESKANPDFSTDWLYANKPTRPATGQMFGVLVCADVNRKFSPEGQNVVLKAFSGQFNSHWHVPGWVPPLLNTEEFDRITKDSDILIHQLSDQIEETGEKINETERLVEKLSDSSANAGQVLELNEQLKKLRIQKSALQTERKNRSKQSMKEIFALYKIHCAGGRVLAFSDIFREDQPPTGWGECCAPKLLNYAYKNGLVPLSMAEFFYGAEPKSALKRHKQFYSPCDEKCALILPHILGLEILYRDEEIVVINKPSGMLSIPGRGEEKSDSATSRLRHLFPHCIEQPSVHRLDMDTSGLLVMALTEESHRNLSMQFMEGNVKKRYIAFLRGKILQGEDECGKPVEKNEFFEENCGKLKFAESFENRTEIKTAAKLNQCLNENARMCRIFTRLENNLPTGGRICLKFRLDVENRPHQIYDPVWGKTGITDWRIIPAQFEKYYLKSFGLTKKQGEMLKATPHTCVEFLPQTGRTHQLRLHSASRYGLNAPIIGDNLYGTQNPGERLMLNAVELEFTHPKTGEKMHFSL